MSLDKDAEESLLTRGHPALALHLAGLVVRGGNLPGSEAGVGSRSVAARAGGMIREGELRRRWHEGLNLKFELLRIEGKLAQRIVGRNGGITAFDIPKMSAV